MVRNSSYNGYGQYFVNKSSCVTARRSSDSDWIKVNKKSRLTNKHPSTSDYISNLKDVSDVETRFPLEFLYDSDENESGGVTDDPESTTPDGDIDVEETIEPREKSGKKEPSLLEAVDDSELIAESVLQEPLIYEGTVQR